MRKVLDENNPLRNHFSKYFEDEEEFKETMNLIKEIIELEYLFDFLGIDKEIRSNDFQYLIY